MTTLSPADSWKRSALAGLMLAAACGGAQATPFATRTAGAATVIAVDLGSIAPYGTNLSAWTYEFFQSRDQRTQIMAVHKVVSCRTRREWDLVIDGYLANGRRLTSTPGAPGWTPMLRGSNSDYILELICRGHDDAWRRLRVATVFDAYRATWR